MDRLILYRIWAPANGRWSPWAKPIVFSADPLAPDAETPPPASASLEAFAPVDGTTAYVLDLPGADSVDIGVAFANQFGLRPVPLFTSAVPERDAASVVLTRSLRQALVRGAALLAQLRLVDDAAPVFLLHANRRASNVQVVPENFFDNRSAVFVSDLPSAAILRAANIQRCVVIRDDRVSATPDLAYALQPWKAAGIVIECFTLTGETRAIDWPPEGLFERLLHRIGTMMRLRPNRSGGYGGFVPESSAG